MINENQTTHSFAANFNKNHEVNQSGWINELVRKLGSCFILVAPSSEYQYRSYLLQYLT